MSADAPRDSMSVPAVALDCGGSHAVSFPFSMTPDVFDIYQKLWLRAENDGAYVQYYTWSSLSPPKLTSDPNGATGSFDASVNRDARPTILIYRLECDDDIWTPSRTRGPEGAHLPLPDLQEELITLAHEYGHLRSFLGETQRQAWNQYNEIAQRRTNIMNRVVDQSEVVNDSKVNSRLRTALLAELSDEDYDRIIQEETLAWRIGRETLADLLITDFKRYDIRRERGLYAHRYRLGREDAWFSDLEGSSATE